jgi:aminoglycoside N3'-acetyltransferase
MARDWERRRTEDRRAGILAALFRNAHRAKNSQPSQPEDFFPSLRDREVKSVNGKWQQTPEQMMSIFAFITGAKAKAS